MTNDLLANPDIDHRASLKAGHIIMKEQHEIWRMACHKQDQRRAALETLLLDAQAMLQHYTSNRPDNWDGSTKTQALVLIAQIATTLEEQKS